MLLIGALLAACSSSDAPQREPPQESASPAKAAKLAPPDAGISPDVQAAVRSLVERFGRQMKKVSTLAPPDVMRGQLQKVYGDLLSPALLETWQAHPDRVVGRKVSSPWPQRIEVGQIKCDRAGVCRVKGRVDYVTSSELAQGGVFMRRAITLEVARGGQGWWITQVHLASARRGPGDAGR